MEGEEEDTIEFDGRLREMSEVINNENTEEEICIDVKKDLVRAFEALLRANDYDIAKFKAEIPLKSYDP